MKKQNALKLLNIATMPFSMNSFLQSMQNLRESIAYFRFYAAGNGFNFGLHLSDVGFNSTK